MVGLTLNAEKTLFLEDNFVKHGILRAAHPTAGGVLFYGTNETCVQPQCGLDLHLVNYIAHALNKEVR